MLQQFLHLVIIVYNAFLYDIIKESMCLNSQSRAPTKASSGPNAGRGL